VEEIFSSFNVPPNDFLTWAGSLGFEEQSAGRNGTLIDAASYDSHLDDLDSTSLPAAAMVDDAINRILSASADNGLLQGAPSTDTASLAIAPAHGAVMVRADGSFVYMPDVDIPGPVFESFMFVISDGQGGTRAATATVTVS
jgi:hypothetical protein